MSENPIGLMLIVPGQDPAAVPLEGVAIHATLAGNAAEVTVAQRYTNRETRPLEAVYIFPLPADAAVCGFAAEVDGQRIEGHVEARDKAFEIYDDAMADGHGAFLLDQERPNIFTASVGNLNPGASVSVQIRYVVACTIEGDAVRFQVPTTVSPRYTPATATGEIGQPDADRIDPERRLHVPYGLTLSVDIEGGARVIESPSHPIRTTLGTDTTPTRVELGKEMVALDRDFVLLVGKGELHTPTARVARDEQGRRHIQVQFVPTFDGAMQSGNEVVFLVDCSGSMGGDSIAQARRAMELCIRALSERDTFDIVRFGSSHDSLFGEAKALDTTTLANAVAHIAATDANMGGTEIYTPLAEILRRKNDAARPRQILLLTDGQVSNESQVIALAQQHANTARVFTFGIGAGVSDHLVNELARVTRGQVELIHPGERIEPKVLRHFGRLRTPTLGDIRVDWGGMQVEQAPRQVPPVFQGEVLTVYARVGSGATQTVTLRAGAHAWSVPIDLERAASADRGGGPVARLWARQAIRDLENDTGRHGSSQVRPGADRGAATQKKLVDLGREYGLLSSATSYVAVEVRADADKTTAPAELRKIPVALTTGWGGQGSAGGYLASAGPAPSHVGINPAAPMPAARKKSAAPPLGRAASAIASAMGGLAGAVGDLFGGGGDAPPARRGRAAPDRSSHPQPAPKEMLAEVAARDTPASHDDRLYDVLLTQAPDGSFTLSPALLRWCGAHTTEVRAAADKASAAQVATAVVLFLLTRDEGARADEWRAAADKARDFMVRVGAFDAGALFA